LWLKLRVRTRTKNDYTYYIWPKEGPTKAKKMCILLIAQPFSYRINAYLEAAKHLGFTVLLASDGKNSLVTEVSNAIQIQFEHPQEALRKILAALKNQSISAVICCDDSTINLASLVAQALGLIHNHPDSAQISQRKDLARQALKQHKCAVPPFQLINLNNPNLKKLKNLSFPVVIKPIHLSASKGVIRCNFMSELETNCQRLKAIVDNTGTEYEQSHALIERYIDGDEVAIEAYMKKGKLYPLVIFDKPEPLIGPYFEETIYVTPSRHSITIQQDIIKQVEKACIAYGLVTGPIHAECRIESSNGSGSNNSSTKAWILEVASRNIGGECARTLDVSGHFSLEELSIALAANIEDYQPEKITGSRGVMMIPIPKAGVLNTIKGIEGAKQVPLIDDVIISINSGHELIPLPAGNQYLGYIFASGKDSEAVTHAIKEAHEKLIFDIKPVWKIG